MFQKKIDLTCQTRDLFIVIRKNRRFSIYLVKEYCEEYFDRYCFIEHLNDIQPETQEVEGCHYHIVGHVRAKGVAKSTHLNNIVKKFKLDNSDGIEIDQFKNEVLAIQYLIHKNHKEKTQHDIGEIVSNISNDELSRIIQTDTDDIFSIDYLYTLCVIKPRLSLIMRELGTKAYLKYRIIIIDIWKELGKI